MSVYSYEIDENQAKRFTFKSLSKTIYFLILGIVAFQRWYELEQNHAYAKWIFYTDLCLRSIIEVVQEEVSFMCDGARW